MEINHFINSGITYDKGSTNKTIQEIFGKHSLDIALINIIQVGDDELLRINQNHLQHDYYTDIITFETESNPKEIELYISYERAQENSPNNSDMELLRLIIHGCLHICGYRDKSDSEKIEMRRLEDLYLKFHVEQ